MIFEIWLVKRGRTKYEVYKYGECPSPDCFTRLTFMCCKVARNAEHALNMFLGKEF